MGSESKCLAKMRFKTFGAEVESQRIAMHAINQPVGMFARQHFEPVYVGDEFVTGAALFFDEFPGSLALLADRALRLASLGFGRNEVGTADEDGRFGVFMAQGLNKFR